MNEKSIEAAIKNMKSIYPNLKVEKQAHIQLDADIAVLEELFNFWKSKQDEKSPEVADAPKQ